MPFYSRILNKFSIINLLLHLVHSSKVVMHTIHLTLARISCCVANAEAKMSWELFAKKLNKCSLANALYGRERDSLSGRLSHTTFLRQETYHSGLQ